MKNKFVRVGVITLIVYIFYLYIFVEDVTDSSVTYQKHSTETDGHVLITDTVLPDKKAPKIDTVFIEKSSTKSYVIINNTSYPKAF